MAHDPDASYVSRDCTAITLVSVALLALVAAIVLPRFMEMRLDKDEANAIAALKTLATSEAIFREGDKEKDGNGTTGAGQEARPYGGRRCRPLSAGRSWRSRAR
jgi:hypothetical protein